MASEKKPVFKRVWFWVVVVIVVVGIAGMVGGGSGSDSSGSSSQGQQQEEVKIEYTKVTVDELSKALDQNAAKAEKTYGDMYVKLTGTISNFDSDGKYINLSGTDEWDFTNFQINLTTDELRDKILDFSKGDKVVVTGQITDIGEVLGYTIDAEKVKLAK